MKNYKFSKAVAVAVAFVFLFTSLAPHRVFAIYETPENVKILNSIIAAVPKSSGYVTDYDLSAGEKIVVYIQDMHCHPGIQRNISKIISSLDKSIGIDKVILEGLPEGKAESNVFLTLPEDLQYPVVEKLLNKGLVTGAELYSVESGKDNIYGAEKWDKYLENIYRAADLLQNQSSALSQIKFFEKIVYFESEKTLGKMNRLILDGRDKNWYKSLNGKEFNDYPTYKYPNLSAYINSLNISKHVNVNKAKNELEKYTQELKDTLSYKEYQEITSEIGDNDKYFEAILSYANSNDLPSFIEKYPNLYSFLLFSEQKSGINPMLVYHDEEAYLDEVIRQESKEYYKSEIYTALKMTALLKPYLSLSMTKKEFEYFAANINAYSSYIERKYPEFSSAILPILRNGEYYSYYAVNVERNNYFCDSIKKLSDSSPENTVNVFVSGGFHTSLVDDLKNSGISYVLITPEISQNFNSTAVYNKIIEVNAKHKPVSGFMRNALTYIPLMLTLSNSIPQETGESYKRMLIEDIAASLNDKSPEKLKAIVDKWRDKIPQEQESISASHDSERFYINIGETKLAFDIKNNVVDFESHEFFVPAEGEGTYESVKARVSKLGGRLAEGTIKIDSVPYWVFRATNKTPTGVAETENGVKAGKPAVQKKYEYSAFTLKARLLLFFKIIAARIIGHDKVNFPKVVYFSDPHGGYKRLVELLSHVLGDKSLTPENAVERIEDVLMKSDIETIYFGGDILDRGSQQIETVNLLIAMARTGKLRSKTGKLRSINGNHDLYLIMNILGLHHPFYEGYKGIDENYTDTFGDEGKQENVKDFWQKQMRENPDTKDRAKWAKALSDYMKHADKRQNEKWKKELNAVAELFTKTFGEELDMKDGKDILNSETVKDGIFADRDLRKLCAWLLGHNVDVMVYTGFRAVDKMSIGLWKEKLGELERLKEKYKDEEYQDFFQQVENKINEVIKEHSEYMRSEIENGNWMIRVIDAIMYGNYSTVEWNTLDWGFHKGWGSEIDGTIAQRNNEIEREYLIGKFTAQEAAEFDKLSKDEKKEHLNKIKQSLTKEQAEELNKKKIDSVTYLLDESMLALLKFYKDDFCIYRRDEYGTYSFHYPLPIDKEGDVAIGRVEDGRIIQKNDDGTWIKGLYYKGVHYQKNDLLKGLEKISEDIRNFDTENGNLADIQEAFTLLISLTADVTVRIKPNNLQKEHYKIGFPRVFKGIHSTVHRLVTGHNPADKIESKGIHVVELYGQKVIYISDMIDNNMSDGYKSMGRMQVHSGAEGIVDYSYPSAQADAKDVVIRTVVSRDQFLHSVLYDICAPLIRAYDAAEDMINGGIMVPLQRIATSVSIKFRGIRESNSVILYPVSTKTEKSEITKQMHEAKVRNVNLIPIRLNNNNENNAFSRLRIHKEDNIVIKVGGKDIKIPVSFMYARTSQGNYIEVYVGNGAKDIIGKEAASTLIEVEELLKDKLYDGILGASTAFLIKSMKDKNNPFEKAVRGLNGNKELMLDMRDMDNKSDNMSDNMSGNLSDEYRHLLDSVIRIYYNGQTTDGKSSAKTINTGYLRKLLSVFSYTRIVFPAASPFDVKIGNVTGNQAESNKITSATLAAA